MGQQIADIECIRRIGNIDQLDLVDRSFGGCITTLYAAKFPYRVPSLTPLIPAHRLLPTIARIICLNLSAKNSEEKETSKTLMSTKLF